MPVRIGSSPRIGCLAVDIVKGLVAEVGDPWFQRETEQMPCRHHHLRRTVGIRVEDTRVEFGIVLDQAVEREQGLAQPTRDRLAVELEVVVERVAHERDATIGQQRAVIGRQDVGRYVEAHAVGRRGASQAPDLAERQPRGVVDQLDHRRLERVLRQQPVGGFGDLVGRGARGCGRHALGAEIAAAGEQRGEYVAPLDPDRCPAAATLAEQVAHEVSLIVHVDQHVGETGLR